MRQTMRGLLSTIILLGAVGCAAGAARDGRPANPARSYTAPITPQEMEQRGQYSNLYELVETLRPRWVRNQGPDTFMGGQGQVQVHMDGNRLGDVEVLRGIPPLGVTSIQWVAPIEAGARYGLDHGHGVILVSTRLTR